MVSCPICEKEHLTNEFICDCGYQRLKNYDQKDFLFEIYKFSKAIFNHKINWENSKYTTIENDKNLIIKESLENKYTISKIDIKDECYSKTDTAILPTNLLVKSLIINVDEIDNLLLDESNVRILFIGDKLKKIKGDNIVFYSKVKYLEVDSKNQFFSSDNNVLFDKNKTKLIAYANAKNETEYYVPSSVKEISHYAFFMAENLKTIHVSKKLKIEDDAIYPKDSVKIIYD